jgi:hypothetical protein
MRTELLASLELPYLNLNTVARRFYSAPIDGKVQTG